MEQISETRVGILVALKVRLLSEAISAINFDFEKLELERRNGRFKVPFIIGYARRLSPGDEISEIWKLG